MRSVLVTGGSGFIGRYVCESLAKDGHQLTILDLVEPKFNVGGKYVRGDVRDPVAVRRALQGNDSVLHLAAAHHDFGIEDKTYFDVNEGSARVVVEEMDRAGVQRACFYSSVAVYGAAAQTPNERTTPAPTNAYGASKLAGERHFADWANRCEGRRAVVIRPSVVFGPGNFANMYALMRQIASRMYIPVGDGTNIKSMAYVENLVAATRFLMEQERSPDFDLFNYVDQPDLSSREICNTISMALGLNPPRVSIPVRAAVAFAKPIDGLSALTGRNFAISSARIRKFAERRTRFEARKICDAGFVAPVPLKEGIQRMARWYLAEGRYLAPNAHIPPSQVGAPSARARRGGSA